MGDQKLPNRVRGVLQFPTPQSTPELDRENGPRLKLRKKPTQRTKGLNTLATETMHRSLKQASLNTGKSIAQLLDEAWALHPANPNNAKKS